MDTANTIKNMVEGGLQVELVFTLLQLMVVGYVLILLKTALVNEFAWVRFKSNINIGKHSRIRIFHASGFVDGVVVSANRRVITIETDKTFIFIPTNTFSDREWVLVKPDNVQSS